jgi:hypothetical protein
MAQRVMATKISKLAKALWGDPTQHRAMRQAKRRGRALARAMATGRGADSVLPTNQLAAEIRFAGAILDAKLDALAERDLVRQFNARCAAHYNSGESK